MEKSHTVNNWMFFFPVGMVKAKKSFVYTILRIYDRGNSATRGQGVEQQSSTKRLC